ncbi:MAG: hypothetical protein ACR2PI_04810 [Hyphomicrobiaceae bacterium]
MRHQAVMARYTLSAVRGICVIIAWATLTAMQVTSTHAVTLSNKDSATYKIEIIAKSTRREHQLGPGKSMANICEQGCIIRLNGSVDDDYELEGSERVSIEGGLVYYDGEEVKKSREGTKGQ